jgi:hypothetical protein
LNVVKLSAESSDLENPCEVVGTAVISVSYLELQVLPVYMGVAKGGPGGPRNPQSKDKIIFQVV